MHDRRGRVRAAVEPAGCGCGDDIQFRCNDCNALRPRAGSAMAGRSLASGYTRMVSWRQRVSAVVIVLLAASPAASNVCATFCASPAKPASHHGSATGCEETRDAPGGPQLSAPSAHDCSTHLPSARQVATAAMARADVDHSPVLLERSARETELTLSLHADSSADYRSPPGSAPPTTTPLVLRV